MNPTGCDCGGYCTGACAAFAAEMNGERHGRPCEVCGERGEMHRLCDAGFNPVELCRSCVARYTGAIVAVGEEAAPVAPPTKRVTVGGGRPGETMEIEVPVYVPEDETIPMPHQTDAQLLAEFRAVRA